MGGNILVDATDPAQHKKVYGSEKYEAMAVQVSDSYIKQHPEVIQAFANAVSEAMVWQAAHSDEEVARMVSPLFPGRNIDAQLIKALRRCLSPDGLFTEEGYGAVVGFCRENRITSYNVCYTKLLRWGRAEPLEGECPWRRLRGESFPD